MNSTTNSQLGTMNRLSVSSRDSLGYSGVPPTQVQTEARPSVWTRRNKVIAGAVAGLAILGLTIGVSSNQGTVVTTNASDSVGGDTDVKEFTPLEEDLDEVKENFYLVGAGGCRSNLGDNDPNGHDAYCSHGCTMKYCSEKCLAIESEEGRFCTGFEFQLTSGRCELHFGNVGGFSESSDFECYGRTYDPNEGKEPTMLPTPMGVPPQCPAAWTSLGEGFCADSNDQVPDSENSSVPCLDCSISQCKIHCENFLGCTGVEYKFNQGKCTLYFGNSAITTVKSSPYSTRFCFSFEPNMCFDDLTMPPTSSPQIAESPTSGPTNAPVRATDKPTASPTNSPTDSPVESEPVCEMLGEGMCSFELGDLPQGEKVCDNSHGNPCSISVCDSKCRAEEECTSYSYKQVTGTCLLHYDNVYNTVTEYASYVCHKCKEVVETATPSKSPTYWPTSSPTKWPTNEPETSKPSSSPTKYPTTSPTESPTKYPTDSPTKYPTDSPTKYPTDSPTKYPTDSPTKYPTDSPTKYPTASPTQSPTDPNAACDVIGIGKCVGEDNTPLLSLQVCGGSEASCEYGDCEAKCIGIIGSCTAFHYEEDGGNCFLYDEEVAGSNSEPGATCYGCTQNNEDSSKPTASPSHAPTPWL